jgi:anthranilate synthase
MTIEITEFKSLSGIRVDRSKRSLDYNKGIENLVEDLNSHKGAYLSSGVEDPDRYSRFDFGFIDPPLEFIGRDRQIIANALNLRGIPLLEIFAPILAADPAVEIVHQDEKCLELKIALSEGEFPEEERSRQPSLFTPFRSLLAEFKDFEDNFMGVYGAFGYDLIFQFDNMSLVHERPDNERALHLYLPDRIEILDRRLETAFAYEYEFGRNEFSTRGEAHTPFIAVENPHHHTGVINREITSDHTDEEYMAKVDIARERMRVGDIFEVVLSRKFTTNFDSAPSDMYQLMRRINPSPYEFFFQFGEDQLIGASPEMFVRVNGDRVESSPISGTARRGANAMEDADRIKALYNSDKDETELTMCTDVDRNDKSRICRPGTIKLLGRRLIERYAGLFHTVDHVEGRLRDGFDGMDAFLSHMWAVTLTGAPKRNAVRIVEDMEVASRGWYGGAVGAFHFDGSVNTGITIRTVHLHGGKAHYQVGATLVWDSVPAEEEMETRIKSTAFFKAMDTLTQKQVDALPEAGNPPFVGLKIVFVDNEDSFVHTLADYFRQTGADVATYRRGPGLEAALANRPDLVIHSPGPGQPSDFGVPTLVRRLADEGVPQFGICLGLQGIVEAFGGELIVLDEPRHGKTWEIVHDGKGLFAGIAAGCKFGAYHSLVAVPEKMPDDLNVVAKTNDGLVMAVVHKTQPIAAVQFHPESILSFEGDVGHQLVKNALNLLIKQA